MDTQHYFDQKIGDKLSFRMVRIPGGSFLMGSPDDDTDALAFEKPQHRVSLEGFWLADTPLTQAVWEALMGSNPSWFKGLQRPVERVSWFDAAVFCNALSLKTGRTPVYLAPDGQPYGLRGGAWVLPNAGELRIDHQADGYRLPTEAEWEYAAKEAGAGHWRYAGSDLLEQVGWYIENSEYETHDTALLLPNALGLYDMSGNVYEWCEDWRGNYTPEDQENPKGPERGIHRVFRGGFWGYDPQICRLACCIFDAPDSRGNRLGFRLAMSLQLTGMLDGFH